MYLHSNILQLISISYIANSSIQIVWPKFKLNVYLNSQRNIHTIVHISKNTFSNEAFFTVHKLSHGHNHGRYLLYIKFEFANA